MAILVALSEAPLREAVVSLIEADGYPRVVGVANAEGLLKALDQPGNDPELLPDCVVMGWQLSDLGGLESLRLVHSKPLWRDLPVIMLLDRSLGSDILAAVQAGAADFIAQPIDGPLLLARLRQALTLKAETDRRKERERQLLDVTGQLQGIIASLQNLSSMDSLTGLGNLRLFDDTLAKEWRRCLREGSTLSLLLADLDDFTRLNARYGRLKGDEALRTVAVTFQACVTRPGDLVARLDGEKFAILLPSVSAGGAAFLAEKIRHAVTVAAVPNEDAPTKHLTLSVGASSILPQAQLRPGFLMAAAEEALFEAKRKGKDRVELNALNED